MADNYLATQARPSARTLAPKPLQEPQAPRLLTPPVDSAPLVPPPQPSAQPAILPSATAISSQSANLPSSETLSQTVAAPPQSMPTAAAPNNASVSSQGLADYPTPVSPPNNPVEVRARTPKRRDRIYTFGEVKKPRPPFLPPSMRIGHIQMTDFIDLIPSTEPEKKTRRISTFKYCLDCIRPHTILYCSGRIKQVQKACSYHQQNPDNELNENQYQRIRKRMDRKFHTKGIIESRPFTVPTLLHETFCGHDKETLEHFDQTIVEQIRQTEGWGKVDPVVHTAETVEADRAASNTGNDFNEPAGKREDILSAQPTQLN